jgi:protease-4
MEENLIKKRFKNPLTLILSISLISFFAFSLVVGLFLKSMKNDEMNAKMSLSTRQAIGIVEINTPIMDSKKWVEQIKVFEESDKIKGVVIRLDSPGGAVGPSQEIYEAVKKCNKVKPVFASMGSVAASGAFYVAMGARKIFANPGTITASIGVIMQFVDLSKFFDWAKVNPYSIKTGKFKDVGAVNRPMSSEEKQLLEAMMFNVLDQFKKAIVEGRKLDPKLVSSISDGRIMSGEQAKQAKLIDELGGLDVTIEALAKEAGIKGKPIVVYPKKKYSNLLEKILNSSDGDFDFEDSQTQSGSMALSFLKLLNFAQKIFSQESNSLNNMQSYGPLYMMSVK